jgi:hypothetical protein
VPESPQAGTRAPICRCLRAPFGSSTRTSYINPCHQACQSTGAPVLGKLCRGDLAGVGANSPRSRRGRQSTGQVDPDVRVPPGHSPCRTPLEACPRSAGLAGGIGRRTDIGSIDGHDARRARPVRSHLIEEDTRYSRWTRWERAFRGRWPAAGSGSWRTRSTRPRRRMRSFPRRSGGRRVEAVPVPVPPPRPGACPQEGSCAIP